MIRRTVLEWQRIAYGDGEDEIPGWAADRIAHVARNCSLGGEQGARIFTHGRHDLRAQQVVGVLAAKDCALEILPKIESLTADDDSDDHTYIRRRLVHMLAIALDIDIDAGSVTDLGWQRENLLEILIRLFGQKVADAVRVGLPRRYTGEAKDLPSLRGRLDVIRQFSTLAATPQRLACYYDELSPDIALNQIMKAAIARLGALSRSWDNQRMLHKLAFAYADIPEVPLRALRWDLVVLDRTNHRWRELITLAKLLLGDRFQTTTSGGARGFSLLFEMNTLFEEYVGRVLERTLRADGFTVKRQGGQLFCLEEAEDPLRRRFKTVPDIIIKRGSQTLVIIDTKWKRLSARIDDPKQGIAQSDIYQMMAYSRVYRCPRLMLLYPHHAGLTGERAVGRYRIVGSADELAIATIDVAGSDVAAQLKDLVFDQLASPGTPSCEFT